MRSARSSRRAGAGPARRASMRYPRASCSASSRNSKKRFPEKPSRPCGPRRRWPAAESAHVEARQLVDEPVVPQIARSAAAASTAAAATADTLEFGTVLESRIARARLHETVQWSAHREARQLVDEPV